MFNVLEQVDDVDLDAVSPADEYLIEHRGRNFDGTIDSDSRTGYSDPFDRPGGSRRAVPGRDLPDFRMPIDDWRLD